MKKKIFIFLPDGVGLRNFAFNDFYEIGKEKSFDITYWNNTLFNLQDSLGYKDIPITYAKPHPFTDILKRARKEIELIQSFKKFKNKAYLKYSFPKSYVGFKNKIKSLSVVALTKLCNSQKGLQFIRNGIDNFERKTTYYKKAKAVLFDENPDFLFCTNQRTLAAVAPILAAKDLRIPTATFIFSWDNLPKAMLVVETDYYFVWSNYMKQELLKYYPFIKETQIRVTGTPQFVPHFNDVLYKSRERFFEEYNLDMDKKYICYSGDDVTTSPNDPYYLEDVVKAVKALNEEEGYNLGIIFRKCPVDFSGRFSEILEQYKQLIVSIDPLWKPFGKQWNKVMPTQEDATLLLNTVRHSELVINLGSTMVFDAACHNKPCAYVNYNTHKKVDVSWNVEKIYKYIHFQSMPNKDAVIWLNSKAEIRQKLKEGLNNAPKYVYNAKKWMDVISKKPQEEGINSIWREISRISNARIG